ncbi:DUF4032 domain-containing protein [bacterium]|jgi:hypothetical protein|nr:DUF4032 domain-containing protein [bacterium]MDA7667968.1 DUF4032 domain-containing protein [Verrucomicrobiota bacterium]
MGNESGDNLYPSIGNPPVQMRQQTKQTSRNTDLVKNLSLYKEFQAEREEILKHKWIESEKAGYDVGFDQALVDWIVNHRPSWRKSRQIVES